MTRRLRIAASLGATIAALLAVWTYVEVYCGPIPPFNTQVSLALKDKTFSRKRNPAFLVLGGSYNLTVQWTGESSLDVSIPATAKVLKNETSVGPVTVNYRPVL